YLFDKRGIVVVDAERYSEDDVMGAIDAGAEDIAVDDDVFEILAAPADLSAVRTALEQAGVEIQSADIVQHPKTRVPVAEDADARRLMRLIESLEESDDVSEVHANFDVDSALLERAAAG